MTTKAERAMAALRECADALDALPSELRFQQVGILGSAIFVKPEVLREEADRIEQRMTAWRSAYEQANKEQ